MKLIIVICYSKELLVGIVFYIELMMSLLISQHWKNLSQDTILP